MAGLTKSAGWLDDGRLGGDALFSVCGRYRYWLTRAWIGHAGSMAFILLNPSTARSRVDDPTVRRCRTFAERERCSRFVIVNLFAWRATDPRQLDLAADPIGPETNRWIVEMIRGVDLVVAGWGGNGDRFPERVDEVRRLLASGPPILCLGTTASGQPRHPLYVASDAPLVDWPRP